MLKRIATGAGGLMLASVVALRACGDDVARQAHAYGDDAFHAVGRAPSSASEIAPLVGEAAAAAPTIPPAVLRWVLGEFRPYAKSALREAEKLLEDDGFQNAAGLAMGTLCTSLKNVQRTGAGTPASESRFVLTQRLGDEGLARRAWLSLQPVIDVVDKVASAASPREMAVASMQELGCPMFDVYSSFQQ